MIPKNVETIMQSLLDAGHEAYIIGGAVRDLMLCRIPDDWDVFTDASGDEILSIFPHGNIIGGDERQAKILTAVVDGVEVSQYRSNGDRTTTGHSLEQHLATCDFTINSMSMDIRRKVISEHGGMEHLRGKTICCVGDPNDRIAEDKLRVLRAVRFAAKYNFRIEKRLMRIIRHIDVADIPVERVREEMLKMFLYPGALFMLRASNLLEKIVPEFEPCFLMDGGRHHIETVDKHMFNAQTVACGLTDNPILVFACAFHDIGKSSAWQRKDDGGTSFHNHETVGAEILDEVMHRLKFSNNDIKYVTTLVAEHMFGPWSNKISNRAFTKHFKRLEDAGVPIEDYMVLLYSDNQSNLKNHRIKFGDFIRDNLLHKKYYELKFSNAPFGIRDLAISGRDLIDVGIPVGTEIGIVLQEVFDAVVDGELENERYVLIRYIKHRRYND